MPVGYHFVIRNEGYVEALGVMPLDDDAEALSFGAGIISDLMEDAAARYAAYTMDISCGGHTVASIRFDSPRWGARAEPRVTAAW
jgi:hypothetical protein